GRGGRMKIETDQVEILGGIRHGKTLGSPICLQIRNLDFQTWESVMSVWPVAEEIAGKKEVYRPRPGHADLAGGLKYGEHDMRNILERASARESAARTAAGCICRQLLELFGIEIASHVLSVGSARSDNPDPTWEDLRRIQDSEL